MIYSHCEKKNELMMPRVISGRAREQREKPAGLGQTSSGTSVQDASVMSYCSRTNTITVFIYSVGECKEEVIIFNHVR